MMVIAFFSDNVFFIKVGPLFFRHEVIAYLIDYSVGQTQLLSALGNREVGVSGFTAVLSSLWWSGAKPMTSPTCACT